MNPECEVPRGPRALPAVLLGGRLGHRSGRRGLIPAVLTHAGRSEQEAADKGKATLYSPIMDTPYPSGASPGQ